MTTSAGVSQVNTTAAAARRQFVLPEDDVAWLDARGGSWWETILIAQTQWLLVHNVALPQGLTSTHVTIAIRIVPGYPSAALDMVYVSPPLARSDGRPIANLTLISIDGRAFQQWSRHYSSAHPWRADVDNIETHLRAADEWFRRAVA